MSDFASFTNNVIGEKRLFPPTTWNVLRGIHARVYKVERVDAPTLVKMSGGDWSELLTQYDYITRQLHVRLLEAGLTTDPYLRYENAMRRFADRAQLQRDKPELLRELMEVDVLNPKVGREHLLVPGQEAGVIAVTIANWKSIVQTITRKWQSMASDTMRADNWGYLLTEERYLVTEAPVIDSKKTIQTLRTRVTRLNKAGTRSQKTIRDLRLGIAQLRDDFGALLTKRSVDVALTN